MTGRGLCVAVILVLCACEKPAVAPVEPESRPEPVVVYASYADEDYLPALFAAFTRQTGIPVTVRHREERQNVSEVIEKRGSPVADVLLTSSVHGIWLAADEGALLPLQSEEIPDVVPDWLRDPDGYWTATAVSTILIAYNEDDLDESSITEDNPPCESARSTDALSRVRRADPPRRWLCWTFRFRIPAHEPQ